mmetsp:Transcript_40990/g.112676  ORF Transcript_40990/g.112676 Transcript_40990/m.112676 type:complete len:84 (+) Transcript_40990:255-506(+)
MRVGGFASERAALGIERRKQPSSMDTRVTMGHVSGLERAGLSRYDFALLCVSCVHSGYCMCCVSVQCESQAVDVFRFVSGAAE